MPMTDAEAKELTERALTAMGAHRDQDGYWAVWDWDAEGERYTRLFYSPHDVRTNACLHYLVDWLDGQKLFWVKDMDRFRRHAVRVSPTPFENEPYLSWNLVPPLVFHDTLGEALARAVVALCAARDDDRGGTEDDA